MRYLIIISLLVFVGCQARYTEAEWLAKMPAPKTMEESNALANLQAKLKIADQTVKDMEIMGWAKMVFLGGVAAAIIAIILGTKNIKTAGIAALAACIAGMGLCQLNLSAPKWLIYIGAAIALPAAGYAMLDIIRAIKDEVIRMDVIKKKQPAVEAMLKDKLALPKRAASTEKIIEEVRAKIK